MIAEKPYLQQISLKRDEISDWNSYPFSIPAIRQLQTMEFHPDITFLIGENGSGKSTLIEAIAVAMGFNAEGGTKNTRFATASTHSGLHAYLKTVRSFKRPQDWYFLRAESFYNVASFMDDVVYLKGYGDKSLHERSHGEAFMATLQIKLRGNGFYIFDEPEAALSPSRQMAALRIIHDLIKQRSQLIIATHSPILLAYPNAKILQLGEQGFEEVRYEETEIYRVTRNFLNRHEKMLDILLDEHPPEDR